jgi:hypothetical protein
MSEDEWGRSECTVEIHRTRVSCSSQVEWDTGGASSQEICQSSYRIWTWMDRTARGSNDERIFFMQYPFLSSNTGTETSPSHSRRQRPPSSVGVDMDRGMTGESRSGTTQSKFPHLPPDQEGCCRQVLDSCIRWPHTTGRNSGQYTNTFKWKIADGDGKTCGTERRIVHSQGKKCSKNLHHMFWRMISSRTRSRIMSLWMERGRRCIHSQSPSHLLWGTVWYKPSLLDIMDNYYEMFRGKNQANKLYLSFTKTWVLCLRRWVELSTRLCEQTRIKI